ncbi:hypothetical protein KDA14_01215 [Candidatus Saccharibacteria bacterium]|nr:hypothetical protein [Candidatus Saccharibacteria bacterium]
MATSRKPNRILTDAAGYGLIILAGLTGWLPGPGGIPLLIAGLGLLSIHNKWAMDLREYLLKHGGKLVQLIFPKNPIAQWAYDIVAIALFAVAAYLGWMHAALWQISAATALFFIAVFVALMNRERLAKFRGQKSNPSE